MMKSKIVITTLAAALMGGSALTYAATSNQETEQGQNAGVTGIQDNKYPDSRPGANNANSSRSSSARSGTNSSDRSGMSASDRSATSSSDRSGMASSSSSSSNSMNSD